MGAFTTPSVTNLPNFMAIKLAKEDILRFSLSRNRKLPRCQRIMRLHKWVPLTISPQLVMFGGHRSYRRGDIKFSVCHVTSCDHVDKSPSCLVLVVPGVVQEKKFRFSFVTWPHVALRSESHVTLMMKFTTLHKTAQQSAQRVAQRIKFIEKLNFLRVLVLLNRRRIKFTPTVEYSS